MPEQKKTEEQLRHDIRRKFDFSEEKEKDRIDKVLEMEKDRFKAVKSKLELKKELEKTGKPVGNKDPVGDKPGSEPKLSLEDSARLLEMKIPVDNWKVVTDYAEFKGIPIKEALGNSIVKGELKAIQEEQQTSGASASGKARRGSSKISGDAVLREARKGNFDDSDEAIDALLEAREKEQA